MAAVESWDDDIDFDGDFNTNNFNTSFSTAHASSRMSVRSESVAADSPNPEERDIFEHEQDDLGGLDIPEELLDFDAILKKRRANDAQLSEPSEPSPQDPRPRDHAANVHKKSRVQEHTDEDEFDDDFDLPVGHIFDQNRRTVNKNLRFAHKNLPSPVSQSATARRSHIPRPVSGQKSFNRLEPVMEHGNAQAPRDVGQQNTPMNMLRAKRSMPALATQPRLIPEHKPSIPTLRPAFSNYQLPTAAAAQRSIPMHLRRDSDPRNRRGAQSPEPRPQSRLSNQWQPDTPSRTGRQQRSGIATGALVREATAKRTVTKPTKRRNYGNGSELDIFEDLQYSQEKEQSFTKEPSARTQPRLGLKRAESRTNLRDQANLIVQNSQGKRTFSQRVTTPAPHTPRSPTHKSFAEQQQQTYTPSYLRDTTASRIARESKLATNNHAPKAWPRTGATTLAEKSTNWKQQIAARSPASSPSAAKKTRKAPQLIRPADAKMPHNQSSMVWNPETMRWEGNENTLTHFDVPPRNGLQPPVHLSPLPIDPPNFQARPLTSHLEPDQTNAASHLRSQSAHSPPRPALIAPLASGQMHNIQVNGGMVFDPRQMKWLKLKDQGRRKMTGPLSPSITDAEEDDPFADIEDLKDENETPVGVRLRAGTGSAVGGMASPVSLDRSTTGFGEVHEEFDLGPQFIRREKEEEARWRQKCSAWFPMRHDGTPMAREMARPLVPPFMAGRLRMAAAPVPTYDPDETVLALDSL